MIAWEKLNELSQKSGVKQGGKGRACVWGISTRYFRVRDLGLTMEARYWDAEPRWDNVVTTEGFQGVSVKSEPKWSKVRNQTR